MPSRTLPACTDGVGLGVVHFHPGRSGLPQRIFHARVGTSSGCFHLPKGETMEGGREDKFLFSFRIEWHSGGTRHWGEGGASLCLNYYAKKQNKKQQLALYIVEGGALSQTQGFHRGAGREATARAMSPAACEGVRSRSVKRPGSCKALGHLTVCFLGTSVG